MKKPLHSFEISCDRCGKKHQCINVTDDYIPPDWRYESIKIPKGEPTYIAGPSAGGFTATGSINYGTGGSITIRSGSSGEFFGARVDKNFGYAYDASMEYLCPDCYNIKDVLE